MRRVHRVFTAAVVIAGAVMVAAPAGAQSARTPETQSVRLTRGSITGTVSDEGGGPLAGVTVSAVGRTWAMAVTDDGGRFVIDSLPDGEYVIQAHLPGFAGSRRETVRVGAGTSAARPLLLRRLEQPVATSGGSSPVYARPIMAAGFALPQPALSETDPAKADGDDHPHDEIAWRLRHLKRSILKDSTAMPALVERDEPIDHGSMLGRAVDSAASLAATFFTDLPFSGEVNVLTTSAFSPGALFQGEFFPRGVAYLSIGAPTPAGDWSLRAAVGEGDLSSWIVAGAFTSRPERSHQYDFGYAYSKQEYVGGNPAALAGIKDGSRNVGEVFAYDRWVLTPEIEVEYGGRYARHDYLANRGLLSPMVALTVAPLKNTWVTTTVAQRMVAPGAEEFLANESPGPWLPPERTFAPLGAPGEAAFSVERARYIDVTVEHEFSDAYVIGVRRFVQNVDNQLATLFGIDDPTGPQSAGHYYVATAGAVDADGWGVRLRTPGGSRVRGSIDYSVTRATWLSRDDGELGVFAPAAVRPEREKIHDITTSFETDIPETATRVFVLCKINSAYTRADTTLAEPGLDARFDVQVNQALPFGLGGTRWEVLVGIRNLFRDINDPGSVYDELLVVRPPKRVVGGFLVRF